VRAGKSGKEISLAATIGSRLNMTNPTCWHVLKKEINMLEHCDVNKPGPLLAELKNSGSSLYPVIHYPYETLVIDYGNAERYEYSHDDELDRLHNKLCKVRNLPHVDNKEGFNFLLNGKSVFVLFYDWRFYISRKGALKEHR